MTFSMFCCFIYNVYPQNMEYFAFVDLIAVYDETDYPIRMENGENWRLFWWYNATAGRWPPDETDTLGGKSLLYCCIV